MDLSEFKITVECLYEFSITGSNRELIAALKIIRDKLGKVYVNSAQKEELSNAQAVMSQNCMNLFHQVHPNCIKY